MTAAALLEMLRPNYAWAQQVAGRRQPDQGRIRDRAVAAGQREHQAATWCVRRTRPESCPGVLVVHENRGLNPYIEDVARRLAIADFMAFAPDGLTSVGGYPGDDEKGPRSFSPSSIAPR